MGQIVLEKVFKTFGAGPGARGKQTCRPTDTSSDDGIWRLWPGVVFFRFIFFERFAHYRVPDWGSTRNSGDTAFHWRVIVISYPDNRECVFGVANCPIVPPIIGRSCFDRNLSVSADIKQ